MKQLIIFLFFITTIYSHLDLLDLPEECEYYEIIDNHAFIANCPSVTDATIQTPHYNYDKECSWINCNGFLLCDQECDFSIQNYEFNDPNGNIYYDFKSQDLYPIEGSYQETCYNCYFYKANSHISISCECDFGEYYTTIISKTTVEYDAEYFNCNGFLYYIKYDSNRTDCPLNAFTSGYQDFAQDFDKTKFPTIPGNYQNSCYYCYMYNINDDDYSLICKCNTDSLKLLTTNVHVNNCTNVINDNGMMKCDDYIITAPGWSIAIIVIFIVSFLIALGGLFILAQKYINSIKHSEEITEEVEI